MCTHIIMYTYIVIESYRRKEGRKEKKKKKINPIEGRKEMKKKKKKKKKKIRNRAPWTITIALSIT